jgi:hypothetical protein
MLMEKYIGGMVGEFPMIDLKSLYCLDCILVVLI